MSKNNKKEKIKIFNVVSQPADFDKKTFDYENYVLVHSKNLGSLICKKTKRQKRPQYYWEGLVKISREDGEGKPVYRKCRACNGINSEEIALGYRTQSALFPQNKQKNKEVVVERANNFCYLWKQFDTANRSAFRAAVYGIGTTIVLSIASIVVTIIYSCCK